MNILFLGDVVGRAGRNAVVARLPALRTALAADVVIVNGENASHGFGLAPEMARTVLEAGADAITLGNHAWDRKELIMAIDTLPQVIRPLNFPPGTPGSGSVRVKLPDGRVVLVLNAMGRLFLEPLDCPFRGTAAVLEDVRMGADGNVAAVVVDFHAEATSEKMSFAHSFDGKVSMVVGTHTHVPTADHTILPGGTAYQSDAGMCGDFDSVIGMTKDGAMARFWRKVPGERLGPAEGEATLCGLFVQTDDTTGLALSVAPVRTGGRLSATMPTAIQAAITL